MWQFLAGLVVGLALGWWLDWYLSREDARTLRAEVAQKNAAIAKLQKELLEARQVGAHPAPKAEAAAPAPVEAHGEPEEAITAYCVKCRAKRPMQNPRRVTLSNGRPALKGTCPVCSTGLFRTIKL
ncbi:MAG: hypothetical protein Kow00123_25500 [Anaerolineales bacterium]